MRHKFGLFVGLGVIFLLGFMAKSKPRQPNILFIAVDDLRPELNCYGKSYIYSPNIDQLAAEGCVFERHYVTVPTCGASRCGLLTGLLSQSKGDLINEALARKFSGKPETAVPETFVHALKRNAYYTVGIGKISHYPDD